MRHSNMLAAGANPGLLAGLHDAGGPGALDASKFEAAAAARSAYDAMAAAAGAGNIAAIQQMEALRRQLGPVRHYLLSQLFCNAAGPAAWETRHKACDDKP